MKRKPPPRAAELAAMMERSSAPDPAAPGAWLVRVAPEHGRPDPVGLIVSSDLDDHRDALRSADSSDWCRTCGMNACECGAEDYQAHKLAPLLSSACEHWNTPEDVLVALAELWPEGIDLDPCSNDGSIVGARVAYTKADDGLTRPWLGRVYVNPPYGRGILAWLERALIASNDGAEVVLLVPARVDTVWWHTFAARAEGVCFWRGRLTFRGAPDPAPFPSAILYYGSDAPRFRRVFSSRGLVWRRPDAGELAQPAQLGLF